MSYMSNAEFAPASGIQELSFDEIDYVAGGPLPLVIIPIAKAVGYVAAAAAGTTAGVAVGTAAVKMAKAVK